MFRAPAFLILAATAATLDAAPVFQPVQGFPAAPAHPVGAPVVGADGNLYCVSSDGGGHLRGAVFRITPTGAVTSLADIPAVSYLGPDTGLTRAADGNFYGPISEAYDGLSSFGHLYRVTPAGDLTLFADFEGAASIHPVSRLLEAADSTAAQPRFYGTALSASGVDQTFYSVTGDGTISTLATIPRANGAVTGDLIAGPDGAFYGVLDRVLLTSSCLYRVTAAGGFTTVCTLPGGNQPTTPVLAKDGNFYLTNGSSIFRVTPGGTITTLHVLSYDGSEGSYLAPLVQGADGNFYGSCMGGGAGEQGTLFRITPTGVFTLLHHFTGDQGGYPSGALVLTRDGSLYGTTSLIGSDGEGTVFKLSRTGKFTSLGPLGAAIPSMPAGGLAQDSAGNLVTLARSGGAEGRGSIVRISPSGALTQAASLGETPGYNTMGGPATGRDGSVYLATIYGAAEDNGAFLRIPARGRVSVLKSFTDAAGPTLTGELLPAADGSFYTIGYVPAPGNSIPAVVRITTTGRITSLATFDPASGQHPVASLFQTSDGVLHGVASGDYFGHDPGTLFHTTTTGLPPATDLSLELPDLGGLHPYSGLVTAPDGTLYGTASTGPTPVDTIYRIRPGHSPELHAGSYPYGSAFPPDTAPDYKLLATPDGCLYGVSRNGGTENCGAVFRVTPAGTVSLVHSFSGPDGRTPSCSLLRGTDGHLYGTTELGGTTSAGRPAGGGELFRIRLGALAEAAPATTIAWNGATLHGMVDPAGADTTVTFQYATEPAFRRPVSVSGGTVAAGQGSTAVTAVLTGLQARRTYYVRLVTLSAENPVPQVSASISFITPKR